jgi:hypothetical protein
MLRRRNEIAGSETHPFFRLSLSLRDRLAELYQFGSRISRGSVSKILRILQPISKSQVGRISPAGIPGQSLKDIPPEKTTKKARRLKQAPGISFQFTFSSLNY